ncbi:glc operon protein GlcG [Granulicella rosea]|uniref:Glc operon protein GlcG n=1 Tax=Granulicella rosea TaxID=474952 RepID=A0A239JWU3_9BACT|nr:heme-binding protein [Granulicella rosea]SNT10220.1 glc operon protein GlcG [Granulicella rosea]
MKKIMAVLSLALMTGIASAQSALNPQTPRPASIDLATARRLIAAAEQTAKAANAKVGIAVVDANGDLVLLERLDGSTGRGVISAEGKARAAILFGLPTKQVEDIVASGKPVSANVTLIAAGAHEITIHQGGFPIIKDGKVIGGIGVGGSASSEDERFAKAGLDALEAK